MSYCGSEMGESEIYSPYSFCGSEAGNDVAYEDPQYGWNTGSVSFIIGSLVFLIIVMGQVDMKYEEQSINCIPPPPPLQLGKTRSTQKTTNRLRMRKGRSVVHKNLEDNYGAVIVANHEALAQVLDQVRVGYYDQEETFLDCNQLRFGRTKVRMNETERAFVQKELRAE